MTAPFSWRMTRSWVRWLICAAVIALGGLMWLGYQATAEWRRGATLLADRRAQAATNLFLTVVTHDMRGVQSEVLPVLPDALIDRSPTAGIEHIASAFARYSYPEVFFTWRPATESRPITLYARAERPSKWLPVAAGRQRFPVVIGTDSPAGPAIADRIGRDASRGKRFSIFDMALNGTNYQFVALLTYIDDYHERLEAAFGFIVNLDWTRQHYFGELASQLARLEGGAGGLTLAVLDDQGRAVLGTELPKPAARSQGTFPMLFVDPLLTINRPPDLSVASWTAAAMVTDDPTVVAANSGAQRTLVIGALALVLLGAGLTLTAQAARTSATLAEARAEFVSTVTHELKGPIATIRAITETLAAGRGGGLEESREYAQMATHEAKRLTRLVDNLLAYSRITDITEVYSFVPLSLHAVVEDTLHEFESQLSDRGFDVQVNIPPELPLIRGDETATGLMLRNLMDNAMRYSVERRYLNIQARSNGHSVRLDVIDHGVGIPEGEIRDVTRKFFRGRSAVPGGTGLGLAIVDRIVSDHGGSLDIHSEVGKGTTVSVTLPMAQVDHEQAHPHS